jgi:hypothetical protein
MKIETMKEEIKLLDEAIAKEKERYEVKLQPFYERQDKLLRIIKNENNITDYWPNGF